MDEARAPDPMAPDQPPTAAATAPAELAARLDGIARDLAYLAERQRRMEEFLTEAAPVGKLMMAAATEELAGLEARGWFRFGKAAVRVADRVVATTDEAALDAFVANVSRLVETTRALTQPAVLDVLADAGQVVQDRDRLEPVSPWGAARAMGEADVQRGLAVLFELLRHLGRAAGSLQREPAAAPRRSVPGTTASGRYQRKARTEAPHAPERGQAAPAAAAPASGPSRVVAGVDVGPDGFVRDPQQWTPSLRDALAAEAGVTLTEAHLALLAFARKDWEATGSSPNIRRLSTGAGLATREIYALFPKAPGKTVARLAGIPKPAGCI